MTDFEKNFYPFLKPHGATDEQVAIPLWLAQQVERWAIATAKAMDHRYDPVVHPSKGRMPAWMACKNDAVALANAIKWCYDHEWRKTCDTNMSAKTVADLKSYAPPAKEVSSSPAPVAEKARRAQPTTSPA